MMPTALVFPPPSEAPPQVTPFTAFPVDLPLSLTSAASYEDDVRIDRAVDGTGRARSFFIAPKLVIDAMLRGMTVAQWREFDAFYQAYRAMPFTVPWGPCDSPVALPVMFSTPPRQSFISGEYSNFTFTLVEFP